MIGLVSNSAYCCALCGGGVASALELKDKLWGGQWDWIDWWLTIAGSAVGYSIRLVVKHLIAS